MYEWDFSLLLMGKLDKRFIVAKRFIPHYRMGEEQPYIQMVESAGKWIENINNES